MVKYGDVRLADELQFSVYNFDLADVGLETEHFRLYEEECKSLLIRFDTYKKALEQQRLPRTSTVAREGYLQCFRHYDLCLKCSHLFNILDARGAISVTERVGVIARVRALAVGIAKAWVDQRKSESAAEKSDEPEPVKQKNRAKKKRYHR